MPNPLRAADEAHPAASPARRFRPRLLPDARGDRGGRACVAAGNWQRDRMHAKEALRAQFEAAARAAPVALASLPAAADWPSLRYRPVVGDGRVPGGAADLHRQQGGGGRAGFHVVTPLELADGRVVLVESRLDRAEGVPGGVAGRAAAGRRRDGAADASHCRRRAISSSSPRRRRGPIRQNLDPARFAAATGLAVLPVGRRGRPRRPVPTTGSCATGRRRISASRRTGSTWCSGTRSRRSRPCCGSGSIACERPGRMADGPTPRRAAARARRARTLLLIAAVGIAPVVASYAAYYLFPRAPAANYGTLLPTAPAPAIAGTRATDRHSRWTTCAGAGCWSRTGAATATPPASAALYATRQARTMQGREQERIVRVWLVAGAAEPPAALLAQHPGLVVVRVPDAVPALLPGGAAASTCSIRSATWCCATRTIRTSRARQGSDAAAQGVANRVRAKRPAMVKCPSRFAGSGPAGRQPSDRNP